MTRRIGRLLAVALAWTSAAHAERSGVAWPDLSGAGHAASAVAGHDIQLGGYLLPVDREGDLVYEFLLVPWPGACIHSVAPAPNQMVRVFPAEPYRLAETYEPVTISGVIKASDERIQVFMVDGVRVLDAAYSMGSAGVAHSTAVRPALPAGANPWQRLTK